MKITDVTTYIVGNPWKNWVFTRVDFLPLFRQGWERRTPVGG